MKEKKREASMGGVGVGVGVDVDVDVGGGGGGGGCCYFHPKEVVVGVCPLCLHERLITLLASSSSSSKQKHQHSAKSIINLFAFPSLLNPLHLLRPSNSSFDLHPHDLDSQEDSFISMKFEDNGAGSWENKNINISKNKLKEEEEEESKNNSKSLVGHAKTRGSLRWRKRIGQMLQLIRWKKRSNVCHVGTKVEGVKVMRKKHRQGWMIPSLIKRKTK